MRLPGGEDVYIDRRKLVDYALSHSHQTGKHKARVFASVLGLTARDAETLMAALRVAAVEEQAQPLWSNEDGTRYRVRFLFRFNGRSAMIVSGWRAPADGSRTRLVTVYVE